MVPTSVSFGRLYDTSFLWSQVKVWPLFYSIRVFSGIELHILPISNISIMSFPNIKKRNFTLQRQHKT